MMKSIHLSAEETATFESDSNARREMIAWVRGLGEGKYEVYAAEGYVLDVYRVDADGEVSR